VEFVERNLSLFFFAKRFLEGNSACGKQFPPCGKGKGDKKREEAFASSPSSS
jgi:hypothetical protein